MALTVGSRLGHYDVTALIGEGGMGQVYRATDTQLGRDVALKILPDAFAADPDRLARFQREAHVLASLNHPGIAAIYGIERTDDTQALVLELVEGPTLADRIAKGPIPLDEALPIAKQIAEALEAAHEAGVIHRDLKPANIKVREDGTVKVLDFGLAKALDTTPQGDPSQSPTLTAAATQMGVILGTAAYMSPEQARGKAVDRRVDIWSFGAVLFEMLTGTRAFAGADVSLTLAKVLEREPLWDLLPDTTSPSLRNLLERCLEKEPRQRVQAVGDVRLAMEGAFETSVNPPVQTGAAQLQLWQRPIPAALAALAVAATASLTVWALIGPAASPADLMRFVIAPPESAPLAFSGFGRDVVISGDGRLIAYNGTSPNGAIPQINLRPIDQVDGAALRGSVQGIAPFFSPGGEWVGFYNTDADALQKVSIFGGPAVTLTQTPMVLGASWGADDQIIFGTTSGAYGGSGPGLFRLSGEGGQPEPLTTLDVEQGETSHTWPFIIPGRDAVLFVIGAGTPLVTGQLAVLDLATGTVSRLGVAGVSPHYVSTGHLVYAVEDGSVRAVPFDIDSLEVKGNPVSLIEGVAVQNTGAANFSVSDNGRLVYASGGSGTAALRSLVWVDREGREEAIAAPPHNYLDPWISPDGTRVVLDVRDEENDVWVWDLAGETLSRLTFDAGRDHAGHWTVDGKDVLFASDRDGAFSVYRKAADGTGITERLTEGTDRLAPEAVTPDGMELITRAFVPGRETDLIVVSLDGDPTMKTILGTDFAERNAALSPDGAWMAFESNSSGQYEVYVRPYPEVESGQWLISARGGEEPGWSPDGDELFYRTSNRMMAVSVETDSGFTFGTPRTLFEGPYRNRDGRTYDVAPDGRFLMVSGAQGSDSAQPLEINVVVNWDQELLTRVPVN